MTVPGSIALVNSNVAIAFLATPAVRFPVMNILTPDGVTAPVFTESWAGSDSKGGDPVSMVVRLKVYVVSKRRFVASKDWSDVVDSNTSGLLKETDEYLMR
jgi:hypothetical protein